MGQYYNRQVDWKRNSSVKVRNANEAMDLHDLVKMILVRMLRRKHPNSKRDVIYTEHSGEELDDTFPDIWARFKDEIYTWEIQKEITKEWTKNIIQKHEQVNLIIVPLKEVWEKWNERIKKGSDYDILCSLKNVLQDYIV